MEANYTNLENVPRYESIKGAEFPKIIQGLIWIFKPDLSSGATSRLAMDTVVSEVGLCLTINSRTSQYSTAKYWKTDERVTVTERSTFVVHPLDGEVYAQLINIGTSYDLYIHGPYDIPDISSKKASYIKDFYTTVDVEALEIYTTKGAQRLHIWQRNCRFQDESNLKHSFVYSYNFCRMECRIRESYKRCGCMPHFYRIRAGDRICSWKGLSCLAKYSDVLHKLIENGKRICNCLQNCDDSMYFIRATRSKFWFLGANFQWGIINYPKMRLQRDVIFSFTDVLVSVGGMAGLFLGFSTLSAIEMIYFYTLKMSCNIIKSRNTFPISG